MVRDDSEEVRGRPCSPSVSRRESQKGKSPRKTRPEITNTHRRLTPRRQRLGRQLPRVHKHGNYRKENRYPSGRSASSGQREASSTGPAGWPPRPTLARTRRGSEKGKKQVLLVVLGFCRLPKPGCRRSKGSGFRSSAIRPGVGQCHSTGHRTPGPGARDSRGSGPPGFCSWPSPGLQETWDPAGQRWGPEHGHRDGPFKATSSATSTSGLRSLGSPAVLPAKQGLPASLSPKGSRQVPTSFPIESSSPKAP